MEAMRICANLSELDDSTEILRRCLSSLHRRTEEEYLAGFFKDYRNLLVAETETACRLAECG
jgi:hypothetical protein